MTISELSKKLLFVTLLVVSTQSFGQWTIYTNDDQKTIYIDTSTIRRDGSFIEFWDIHNYKFPSIEVDGSKVTSTKGKRRYDCKNELQRTLFFTMYEGEKGTGRVLGVQNYINEKPDWSPIIPDTPNMIILKRLCSKK
jgi:hypothetical protein